MIKNCPHKTTKQTSPTYTEAWQKLQSSNMSPEWQKLQPRCGLGSAMTVTTHSHSTTRKLISNNLRL